MTALTWEQIYNRITEIRFEFPNAKFFGVPTGGSYAAGLTGQAVQSPDEADVIIDDIIDSGRTREKWLVEFRKPFVALHTKAPGEGWVRFPWEGDPERDAETVITRQLELIGEDAKRDGLKDTPSRVVRSWKEVYGGYQIDPRVYLRTFEKGGYDSMVVLKDCELYSTCEHHLQPFFGKVHIGYIPNDKVIGLSKLARIAECFSRRLQIQERIGEQITNFLMKELEAKGAGCVIEAKHLCMMARGVNKQNSVMVTSSLKGVMLQHEARSEFLSFVRG